MKVEILSRELIKPCSATPPSFRKYNISLIDEFSPNMNVPTIFYYSATDQDTTLSVPIMSYKHLKNSLSKVLSSFHPFAGRYNKETHSVDCSDQGAEFVEAKVDVQLDDLLSQRKNLKVEVLNDLLPCPLGAVDEYTDPLLAVQVSAFSCGGFAIAVCSSHRIADMTTTISVVKAWAIATKMELGYVVDNDVPNSWNFDSALLFPGQNLPSLPSGISRDKENIEVHKVVTKMFYFSESKILSIRERAKVDKLSKILPTRVQSVFGIIGKAIIDVHVANPENPKGYAVVQAVNMRERTVPPLKNQFGNLYLAAYAQSVVGSEGVELPYFVDCLSSSVKSAIDNCSVVLSLQKEGKPSLSQELRELLKSLANPEIYFAGTFSSWCKFPLYEADFGWGKPAWVSNANIPMKNLVILVDEKSGGGIEAWVNLKESDMKEFIKHNEIKDIIDCN
ncbi:epi-neemfruitin B synthase L1AT-like [Apium graveolens]|uniref:epi-neemfruitin B synthase L1AT-like n=1 Tax=Apium graveolens TaxID=4045 RepID=UPI003D78DD1C